MSEYSTPTQFIDIGAQQKLIRSNIDNAIQRVLDHGQYIMGPEVKEFESKLRKKQVQNVHETWQLTTRPKIEGPSS